MVQKRQAIGSGQPDPAQVLSGIVAQPVAPTLRVNIKQPELLPLTDFSKLSKTLEKFITIRGKEQQFQQETEASRFAKQQDAEKRRNALRVGQAKAIEDGLIPAEATETFWNEYQRTAAEMDVAEFFTPAIEAKKQELVDASPEERTRIWNEVWAETVQSGGDANFYYTATANAKYEELFANSNREYIALHSAQSKDKAYRDAVWLTGEVLNKDVVPVLNSGDPAALKAGWESAARFVSEKWKGAQLNAKPQPEMLKDVVVSMASSMRVPGTPEVRLRGAEKALDFVLDAIDNAKVGDDGPGGSGFREAFPEGSPERAALSDLANQLQNTVQALGASSATERQRAQNAAEQVARNSALVASLGQMVEERGVSAGDDFVKEIRAVGAFTDPAQFDEKAKEVFDKFGLVLDDSLIPALRQSEESLSFFIDEFDRELKSDFLSEATEADQLAMTRITGMLDRGEIFSAMSEALTLGTNQARAEATNLIEQAKGGDKVMASGPVGEALKHTQARIDEAVKNYSSAYRDNFIGEANAIVQGHKMRLRAALKKAPDQSPEGMLANSEVQEILTSLENAITTLRDTKNKEREEARKTVFAEVNKSTVLEGGTSNWTVEMVQEALVRKEGFDPRDPVVTDLYDVIKRGTATTSYINLVVETQFSEFLNQLKDSDRSITPTPEQLAEVRAKLTEGVKAKLIAVAAEKQPNMRPSDYWANGENQSNFSSKAATELKDVMGEATQALLVAPSKPQADRPTVTETIKKAEAQESLVSDTLMKAEAALISEKDLTDLAEDYFTNDPDKAWGILDNGADYSAEVRAAFDNLDLWSFDPGYSSDAYDPLIENMKKAARFEDFEMRTDPGTEINSTLETTVMLDDSERGAILAISPLVYDEALDGLELGQIPEGSVLSGDELREKPGEAAAIGSVNYFDLISPLPGKLENESLITTEVYYTRDKAFTNEYARDTAYGYNKGMTSNGLPDPWTWSDRRVMLQLENEYLDDNDYDSPKVIRTLAYSQGMLTSKGFPVDWVIEGKGSIVLSATREAVITPAGDGRRESARPAVRVRKVDFSMELLADYDPTQLRIGTYDEIERFFAENIDPRTGAFRNGSDGAKWLEASNRYGMKDTPLANTKATVTALHLQQLLLSRPWTNNKGILDNIVELKSELANTQKKVTEQR